MIAMSRCADAISWSGAVPSADSEKGAAGIPATPFRYEVRGGSPRASDQKWNRISPPMMRGSLIMPVRLLKSIALCARIWLRMLRANAATS